MSATNGTPRREVASELVEDDPLFVRSIEKAFRVLRCFDSGHASLSLSQVAAISGLDKSAAQRFTHTLERLQYLRKDPDTRRFELTSRVLDLGYHFTRSNQLVDRARPYLLHLSTQTEESVSLTMLEGTDVVYVARVVSRHMLNTNVIVGSRLPAYCTAPGVAMLSQLPIDEAHAVLRRSDLKSFTPQTVTKMPDLLALLERSVERGYAMLVEAIYANDISLAAAIRGERGRVLGAVSIAVSKLRMTPEQAEERYAPLLLAAAQVMSRS